MAHSVACVLCSTLLLAAMLRAAPEQVAQPTPGVTRVSGWTTTPDRAPLSGVEVALACPPQPVRRTLSDDQGRFELSGLPAANCRLIARKEGFVEGSLNGDPAPGGYGLKIRDGESRDGLEVQLARGAILSGRIVDDQGAPAAGVRIHPVRREIVDGRERLTPATYFTTQPGGKFRYAGLAPGDYYLGAGPAPAGDTTEASGLAFTYFPGVSAIAKATLITLKAGEARDLDIALRRAPAFEVSGQVIDVSGNPVADASVTLTFAEPPQFIRGSVHSQADGRFMLKGVEAGDYGLDVVPKGARGIANVARLRITVDGDISNLIARVTVPGAPGLQHQLVAIGRK